MNSMKVLAITNVFPNLRQPNRGVFNEQQFAALRRHADVRVIAPVAWQPWKDGFVRRVPYEECWSEIRTLHPFYFYTPAIGRAAYAVWLYCALRRLVTRVVREYRPDVLLTAWAYPDAVATAALARRLALPWVAKVHGSDVNVYTAAPLLRRQIRWALRQASCTVAVSSSLKQRLVEIGVPAGAVRVLHNGVNTERFQLRDKSTARRAVGLPVERRIILYVGNLEVSKGVADLLEAARRLAARGEEAPLVVMVGGGTAHAGLAEQIRREGLESQVLLTGPLPHAQVPDWMAAMDILCLPSWREGCPNVILEALACGRPVVASNVGGIPDLIDASCGALVEPREPGQLAAVLQEVAAHEWDAAALRERVRPLSWEENARVLAAELERAAHRREHGASDGAEAPSAHRSPLETC